MKAGGVVRVLVAGGVGAGLVYGAGQTDARVDLRDPADRAAVAAAAPSPALASASVTCPGPDRGGRQGDADPKAGDQQVTVLSSSAPRTVLPPGIQVGSGGSTIAVPLGGSLPGSAGGSPSGEGPTKVASMRAGVASTVLAGDSSMRLDATAGMAPGNTAAQSGYDSITSARGLTYVQCTAPVRDAWVLAGGNETGGLTRVVLANPGDSPITVDLTVIGSAGRDPASVTGTTVPPGRRTVLTLAALSSGTDPAIHVTSTGGSVAVAATDVWVSGESRTGEETTGAGAAPATRQVLPIIDVVSASAPAPSVRVATPGAEDAVVRVRATRADGSIATEKALAVATGRTGSVALAGLTPGVYAVQVISDVPVVAAASIRSTASGNGDISWATAAPAVQTLSGAALPSGLQSASTLGVSASGGTAKIVISTVSGSGAVSSTEKTIAAGTPILQPLRDAQAVWVRVSSGSVRAGIAVRAKDRDGALIAASALAPLPLRDQAPVIVPATD